MVTLRGSGRAALDIAAAGVWGACLCVAAGSLAEPGWPWDLLAHFHVVYAVFLVAAAAALPFARRPRTAALALAGALWSVAIIWPHASRVAEPVPPGGPVLKILYHNVYLYHPERARVIGYLRDCDADFLVLAETDEAWIDALERARLPYRCVAAMPESRDYSRLFGISAWSRVPVAACRAVKMGSPSVPAIEARLDLGGSEISLLGVHPIPPLTRERSRQRDTQIGAIAGWVAAQEVPAVVIGDLNDTPWTGSFRSFLAATGLAVGGRGLGLSWPSFRPFLPLDHCLHDRRLSVKRLHLGRDLGSDHRPLHVTLGRTGNAGDRAPQKK